MDSSRLKDIVFYFSKRHVGVMSLVVVDVVCWCFTMTNSSHSTPHECLARSPLKHPPFGFTLGGCPAASPLNQRSAFGEVHEERVGQHLLIRAVGVIRTWYIDPGRSRFGNFWVRNRTKSGKNQIQTIWDALSGSGDNLLTPNRFPDSATR